MAVHQLCLFHETRRVTGAVMKLINRIRKNLPAPPPVDNRAVAPRRSPAPGDDPSHPAKQYWQQRQTERNKQVAWVHQLAEQGLSQRAIVRRTGFNRRTVRAWLQLERPDVPEAELPDLVEPTPPPSKPGVRKRIKIRHAQALAGQGLSYCEIARQLGGSSHDHLHVGSATTPRGDRSGSLTHSRD